MVEKFSSRLRNEMIFEQFVLLTESFLQLIVFLETILLTTVLTTAFSSPPASSTMEAEKAIHIRVVAHHFLSSLVSPFRDSISASLAGEFICWRHGAETRLHSQRPCFCAQPHVRLETESTPSREWHRS
jgi:hypothetical protein